MEREKRARLVKFERDWVASDVGIDYKLKGDEKWKMKIPLTQARKDFKIVICKNKKDWLRLFKDVIRRIWLIIKNPFGYLELNPLNDWQYPGKKVKNDKLKANKKYWIVMENK